MGQFGLLNNYSADPSLGKMGGLKDTTGVGAAGGLDFGSIAAALLPMLIGGMGKDKAEPQQSVIGGTGGSPIQTQMPQFNRPPSMGALIASMLAKTKGGY